MCTFIQRQRERRITMPIVDVMELMADARKRKYAVGYFESWDLESTQAVAAAAEKMNSPVIIGFSGIYLPHPERIYKNNLKLYANTVFEIAHNLKIPASTLFNESSNLRSVLDCIEYWYNLVMFTDENLSFSEQAKAVKAVVSKASVYDVRVEGEMMALHGSCGNMENIPKILRITDVSLAKKFIDITGIDLFAVNIGQAHLHSRKKVKLDIEKLKEIRKEIELPLVLHGMSSVEKEDIVEAVKYGINKINVSSILKQAFFENLRKTISKTGDNYNPYLVVGSGFASDVITQGNMKVQEVIEELMVLFGSAGKF